MVVLYVKIFLAIKRRSKEMEKMTAFQSKRDDNFCTFLVANSNSSNYSLSLSNTL